MEKIVYDGTEAVFGRLATQVAKDLLKGNEVEVVNCEQIIISGDKKKFVDKILRKRKMGQGSSMKGPKYIRESDRLIKRMIRGMLPRDTAKGQAAYKRLKCYAGNNDSKKSIKFEHKKPTKYSTINEVVKLLK